MTNIILTLANRQSGLPTPFARLPTLRGEMDRLLETWVDSVPKPEEAKPKQIEVLTG